MQAYFSGRTFTKLFSSFAKYLLDSFRKSRNKFLWHQKDEKHTFTFSLWRPISRMGRVVNMDTKQKRKKKHNTNRTISFAHQASTTSPNAGEYSIFNLRQQSFSAWLERFLSYVYTLFTVSVLGFTWGTTPTAFLKESIVRS